MDDEPIDMNRCRVCEMSIAMIAFKGTGFCCENHRKQFVKEQS